MDLDEEFIRNAIGHVTDTVRLPASETVTAAMLEAKLRLILHNAYDVGFNDGCQRTHAKYLKK